MKERPILFSGPMVRALLDGRKTQTRRALKSHPPEDAEFIETAFYHPTVILRHEEEAPGPEIFGAYSEDGSWGCKCPYGAPGDRLWVRETHEVNRIGYEEDSGGLRRHHAGVAYKADDGREQFPITSFQYESLDAKESRGWTPSIHMPRWASRITLEVTGVRVERLQAMEGQTAFESDALKEGIHRIHHGDGEHSYHVSRTEPHPNNWVDPCDAFRDLWDSLNAARGYAWVLNPWVWVIEFKRIDA